SYQLAVNNGRHPLWPQARFCLGLAPFCVAARPSQWFFLAVAVWWFGGASVAFLLSAPLLPFQVAPHRNQSAVLFLLFLQVCSSFLAQQALPLPLLRALFVFLISKLRHQWISRWLGLETKRTIGCSQVVAWCCERGLRPV